MAERSGSGLRITAAAIGLLLIGGNALPASEITVTTASTRLEFTSPDEGLRLRSLVDRATKREFLPRAGDGLDVWELVLVDAERKICAVHPGPGAKYAMQRDPTGAAVHRLSWHRLDLPAAPGALDVEATIVVPPESALSYWTIAVTNHSTTWGVWHVRFPRFARLGPLGDPAEDRLLSPHTTGQLFRNPYACLNLPEVMRYPSKVKKSEAGEIIEGGPLVNAEGVDNAGEGAHYPGYASFQMCALYAQGGAGLYYAAHDGQGYYKQFCYGPTRDRTALDLYLQHAPEGKGLMGTGYRSPFPVVIGTFQGDWLTATKLYRQWAEQQVWCAKGRIEKRADMAPWFKQLAVWEFITANSYGAMHHYRALLGGLPWANHWNYIWGVPSQGDVGSPNLFPPVGGDQQMKEETAKLKAAGIHGIPYFLGSALDVKSPQYAEWGMEKNLVRGGQDEYGLWNPSTPYIWVYPQARFAWPCPHLDAWPNKAVDIVRHMMELGSGGVYLDTTTGNGYQCFSKEHGHPVGGGNYWALGNRRYLQRIRDVVKSMNPDGIMTGENACEIYNDLMDGYLLYNHDNPAAIPAFQAIYHDYVGTYGQFLSTSAKIGEDYPFMLPIGISFINGDQFGCTARTDYTMSSAGAAEMAWLRRLAHFRVKCVNKYMALGEMVRAPRIENVLPEVSGCWKPGAWSVARYGTETMARPAVMHSAWRASDGSVGIVFINISERARQIAFSLRGDDYGFPPDTDLASWTLRLADNETPVRESGAVLKGGAGRIEHTLGPRGMWALEIARPGHAP